MPVTLSEPSVISADSIDEGGDEEVRSNDDDDDAGSLVDFVVEDDGEESGDDNASVTSEPPKTAEEARARDLDGIVQSNIVVGKRTRRQTKFYEQEVFNTDEYRKMIFEDVPDDERHAIEESSDDDREDDEEDENYECSDDDDSDDDSDDDIDSTMQTDNEVSPPVSKKSRS